MRVTEFGVAHYCHQDLLLRVSQMNGHEVLLCDINDTFVLSLAQSFCAYGLDQMRGTHTLSTNTTKTVPRSVKVPRRVSLAFPMKLHRWFSSTRDIGFKRCMLLRRQEI